MYLTPSHRKLLWLDRCTSRLVELQPRLDADEAWDRAELLLDKTQRIAPEQAAETYVRGAAPAQRPRMFGQAP